MDLLAALIGPPLGAALLDIIYHTSARGSTALINRPGEMFSAEPENVCFTQNCTYALNLAIKGVVSPGDTVVISSLEHNAVARPVYALSKRGVRVEVAAVESTDGATLSNFKELLRPGVCCAVVTAASNVTGRLLPIADIADLCRKNGICLIVDGAQVCGTLPISLSDGINILCTAGHKGLYGPSGTGLLISDGKYELDTIIEGGTGATSGELSQTDFLPERLESGTLNTAGIAGLGAGLDFVRKYGIKNIYSHEAELCAVLEDGLKSLGGFDIYREGERFAPILSFNLRGLSSEELARKLSDEGFALRGGLQCAPLAHKTLGTFPDGTVRFSPSVFSSSKDAAALLSVLKKICKTPR